MSIARGYVDKSEIVPGLWMGAHPGVLGEWPVDFDAVICLSGSPSIRAAPHEKLYVWWPIFDGNTPDPSILVPLARMVMNLVNRGAQVLVHCDAGLNRSGLVSAMALVHDGYTPETAIDQLRATRGQTVGRLYGDPHDPTYVLCNSQFVAWLKRQGGLGRELEARERAASG